MSRLPLSVPAAPDFSHWVAAISVCWLAVGSFALTLTPLPAHTAEAGWSPAFWLVLAPACALAGLRLRAQRRCA